MNSRFNKNNKESRCFRIMYNRYMKDFLDSEDLKDLRPLIETVDLSRDIEEKIGNVNTLIREITRIFRRLDYLSQCAKVLLDRLKGINLLKRIELKKKLKTTDKMIISLLEFEKYSISQLKFLEEQLTIEV